MNETAGGPRDEQRPGERGAAAEAGIVDQQDAVLNEMKAHEGDDADDAETSSES